MSLIAMFYIPFIFGQSMLSGNYLSEGDTSGNGKCTLIIKSLEASHQYGDEVLSVESSGVGSCEWSAIGIAKSSTITAGMVTNAGIITLIKLEFPFGPAGNRIEITSFEIDGSERNKEVFNKLD
jgi:hypothetical protein